MATTWLPTDGGGHVPSHQLLPSILTSIVVVAKWPEIPPGVGAAEIKGLEPKWVGEYKTEGLFAENYVGGDNDDDVDYNKNKPKAINREPSKGKHNSTQAFSATAYNCNSL